MRKGNAVETVGLSPVCYRRPNTDHRVPAILQSSQRPTSRLFLSKARVGLCLGLEMKGRIGDDLSAFRNQGLLVDRVPLPQIEQPFAVLMTDLIENGDQVILDG